MPEVLIPERLFDGEKLLSRHAVVVEGGRIQAVLPANAVDTVLPRRHLEGLLAPGFIDVQVNGGGEVQFNDVTTPDGIAAIGAAHRRFGTTGYMVTLITDTRAKTEEAVAAVNARSRHGPAGAAGHPYRGALPQCRAPRRPCRGDDPALGAEGSGDSDVAGRRAHARNPGAGEGRARGHPPSRGGGVIVAAGHTASDYETVRQALALGLTGFTHLYNAMPPLAGRDPGPVGAALEDRAAGAD